MDQSMSDSPDRACAAARATFKSLPHSGEAADSHAMRCAVVDAEDPVLNDRTIKWVAALPVAMRPFVTGRLYPRIVNRIADLWPHCEYTRLYFQSLLIDRRKGRKGFPPEVKCELEALQHYYFLHLSGLPAILWNAMPLRPAKIPNKVFPRLSLTTEIEILPL